MADMVEVVRCKDCDVPHNRWLGCPNLNGLIPPPDFYCAKGKRKEHKTKECKLYILYRGNKLIAYRYGEPWVSQQLLMEGGYSTPEEAKEAWYKWKENHP